MKKLITLLLLTIFFSCSAIESEKKEKTLKGFYSYMADAGIFTDCETNKKYPVAFEADNIALERAYLKARKDPGEKIIVTLSGHYESRAKMEGDGEREFLIVAKFNKIFPHIDCVQNLGTANLKNTFWSLRELNGKSTKDYKVDREMHLLIKNDSSIKGFSGCNNFFGNSSISNDSLRFSQIGSTRMMCKNIELETEYFKALEKTNRYEIYGEYLYLYFEEELLAIFESVYFN
ncbi:MAG: META domain-containing protein [Melioribacteraceae bacterium]|nr:META domain-containing protein [Melioribacteraceae bacterium]